MTIPLAADVIKAAKHEADIHYQEGRSNGHWDNHQKYSPAIPGLEWSQNQAWCCTFCVWCAMTAGDKSIVPVYAGCALSVATYKQWGRFSFYPAVGAQVFFGTDGGTHTGLVIAYDKDTISTVEGNTSITGSPEGDGVYYRTHHRLDPYVYGYGYPKYRDAIVSADPEWQHTTTGGTSKPVTTPPKPPAKPKVSLAHLIAAARHDPTSRQGATTWKGDVLLYEQALIKLGYLNRAWGNDGSFGTKTITATSLLQRDWSNKHSLGWTAHDCNGIPGAQILSTLASLSGMFTAAP